MKEARDEREVDDSSVAISVRSRTTRSLSLTPAFHEIGIGDDTMAGPHVHRLCATHTRRSSRFPDRSARLPKTRMCVASSTGN